MTEKYKFERGVDRQSENWEKLYEFMDQHEFTTLDFLACVCAHLCNYSDKRFSTCLMAGGTIFDIFIKKRE